MPHIEFYSYVVTWDTFKKKYVKIKRFKPVIVWTKKELLRLKEEADKEAEQNG